MTLRIIFNDPSSNWTIQADDNDQLWSIPKKQAVKSSYFGDKNHIKKLLNQCEKYGLNNDEYTKYITEAGRELMCGLNSKLFTDTKGNRYSVLRFN